MLFRSLPEPGLADRERARKAGFREHLVKPIDLERLLTILER